MLGPELQMDCPHATLSFKYVPPVSVLKMLLIACNVLTKHMPTSTLGALLVEGQESLQTSS